MPIIKHANKQKIATFLSAIASKYQTTGNLCSANGLYTRFIARVGAFPGRPGAGVFTGDSPIAELADNLSSDDRLIGNPQESEMVFLDQDLNGLKRAVRPILTLIGLPREDWN